MMNNDCKNPEAGMKLVDWLIGGGYKNLMFGEEGVHYQMDGDVPVTICDSDTYTREVDYARKYAILADFVLNPEWIPKMANKDELSQKLAAEKVDAMEVIGRHKFRRDIPYNPPISRVSSIVSDFSASVNGITVKYITGGNQYDEKNGVKQSLNANGSLQAVKKRRSLHQKWYKENIDMIKAFQAEK
ncbi:MAG: hypothetical protein L6V93_22580 [Clostridiales bacterium]|nr:MAG: hypothetical protein L6V93_22580 [Clostridiales bacterium]